MLHMEVARRGLEDLVQKILVPLYADDGVLSARCPVWLQTTFNIRIGVFKHVGLCTNSQMTKAMMCFPGKIRVSMMEEVNNDYCQAANVYRSFVLNRDLDGVRMPAIF